MTAAKNGDEVIVSFTVHTAEGMLVGGTGQDGPQPMVIGSRQVFEDVETALIGMSVGDEKKVVVAAESAFGPRRDEMILTIPRDQLPADQDPQPGMRLSAKAPGGGDLTLTVVDVKPDAIVVDGNHPLAGEDLHFVLTLVEIKKTA